MDLDRFWSIVETTRLESDGTCHQQVLAAIQRLGQLDPEEIVEFERLMDGLFIDAYRWDLWGAAFLINDGCSDSGFYGFRGWLIAQGRQVYENALRNPDSLADHPQVMALMQFETLNCEDFLSVADSAYEDATGVLPSFEEGRTPPTLQGGKDWDFDDDTEMRRRYPRLWAVVRSR